MNDAQVNVAQERTRRPHNAFTLVLPDAAAADGLVTDLAGVGVDQSEVRVFAGDEGLQAFDTKNETHSWIARLLKSFGDPVGRDSDVVSAYREALRVGRVVALVPVAGADFDTVVDLLRRHGARAINFFTPGSLEAVPSR